MPGAAPEPAGADGGDQNPAVNGAPPALDLRGIRKSWGQHEVLKGIDLQVDNGR